MIAHLAVDPNFRRQGIAQALIARAGEDALTFGIKKLVLEVEMENEKAITLYNKAGFAVINSIYYKNNHGLLKCPGFYKMLKNL